MLANPLHSVTVHELPTYYPDEAERRDAKLYASNVRQYMAKQCKLRLAEASLADKRRYHQMLRAEMTGAE
uniref:Lysophosphatidylcholine acyltransferase / lyso-PAF acetyltransferase n=1 Tax=Tetraselmis sp. GSL018 TaxID=582737 RepID=A0A061RFG0_9CHLO